MSGPIYEPIPGHAGFYRHGASVAFRFRDRRGKRRWASAPTLRAAERKKVELELDVRRGDYTERMTPRFDEYARAWIETYAGRTSRGVSEQTRDDYRTRIESDAIPHFGRRRLGEIEPRDVKEYVAAMAARGIAKNTVRLGLAPVRALFATAVEEGLLRANPAAGLRLFVQPSSGRELATDDVKALTEAQLRALLDAVPGEWRVFFEFLAQTGLRIGEAVEVRYGDVDFGQRWLNVRRRFYRGRVANPKSGKARRIRLTAGMAEVLLERREAAGAGDDELVFTAERGDRLHQSNMMNRVLKPAAVEAGLGRLVDGPKARRAETWVGFHTFRHTCATLLFRNGWNAVQVQKFLGHADPGFTLRTYVHLLPEDLPEPSFLERLTARDCDHFATTAPRNDTNSAAAVKGANALLALENPAHPQAPETLSANS